MTVDRPTLHLAAQEPADQTATINTCSTASCPSTTSATSKPSAPPSPKDDSDNTTPTTKKTSSPTSSKNAGSSAPATKPAALASAPGLEQPSTDASTTTSANATAERNGNSQTTPTNGNGHNSKASNITWESAKSLEPEPAYKATGSAPNWLALSPRHTGILLHIEIPVTWYGYSEREVATKLGVTTSVVKRCRTELHNHLAEQPR